jgi:hypothetical protein
MSTVRAVTPGKSRDCPHCRSEILESAVACPACRHHLRFESTGQQPTSFTGLSVDGTIRHPGGDAWEYTVIVSVRNERGSEIARKAVNVGALTASELRSFSVSVEVTAPGARTAAPASSVAGVSAAAAGKPAQPARPASNAAQPRPILPRTLPPKAVAPRVVPARPVPATTASTHVPAKGPPTADASGTTAPAPGAIAGAPASRTVTAGSTAVVPQKLPGSYKPTH